MLGCGCGRAGLVLGAVALIPGGALLAYWVQVWAWGMGYASGSPVAHPLALALERVGHWLGFHLALALGWCNAIWHEEREEQVKLALWLGFSFAAVCLGNHFAPRYFLQMLPPLAVVGARGIALALGQEKRWAIAAICLLLAVPFVRFGPRYLLMARHAPWGDIALDLDSQQVSARINALKRPGDTLFVWGYRPDMYVFTRLSPPGVIWDSQPLTGVAADRHLTAQEPSLTRQTEENWYDAVQPVFLVDGLGPLNNNLRPEKFEKMRRWLKDYREIGRTKLSIIYRRIDKPTS